MRTIINAYVDHNRRVVVDECGHTFFIALEVAGHTVRFDAKRDLDSAMDVYKTYCREAPKLTIQGLTDMINMG